MWRFSLKFIYNPYPNIERDFHLRSQSRFVLCHNIPKFVKLNLCIDVGRMYRPLFILTYGTFIWTWDIYCRNLIYSMNISTE